MNFPVSQDCKDSAPSPDWKSRVAQPFVNNYGEELDSQVIEAYLEDVTDEESFAEALEKLKEHRPMDLASSDTLKAIKEDIEDIMDGRI